MKSTSLFRMPVLALGVLAVALLTSPARGDAIMS